MTFTLHVDGPAWRRHADSIVRGYRDHDVDLCAVVKGNGYGFGTQVLCREAQRLALTAVAVGTVHEAEHALAAFAGDVLVLEPFHPADTGAMRSWTRLLAHHSARTVVTIAGPHLHDAQAAGATRVRLEGSTSMQRFGMTPAHIDAALRGTTHSLAIEGLSLHLPISEPDVPVGPALEQPGIATRASGWVRECLTWVGHWRSLAADHGLPLRLSVSHLTADDAARVRQAAPDVSVEARVGTRLWLGAPSALRATGTVLAVHPAGLAHRAVGYTQVDSHGHGQVVVVSGGTSHGVALAAPTAPTTVRKRAIAIAEGLSEASGRVVSPFTADGRALRFVEPPHMHTSLLWGDSANVSVGDELECRVRHTTATFDVIVGLD